VADSAAPMARGNPPLPEPAPVPAGPGHA